MPVSEKRFADAFFVFILFLDIFLFPEPVRPYRLVLFDYLAFALIVMDMNLPSIAAGFSTT